MGKLKPSLRAMLPEKGPITAKLLRAAEKSAKKAGTSADGFAEVFASTYASGRMSRPARVAFREICSTLPAGANNREHRAVRKADVLRQIEVTEALASCCEERISVLHRTLESTLSAIEAQDARLDKLVTSKKSLLERTAADKDKSVMTAVASGLVTVGPCAKLLALAAIVPGLGLLGLAGGAALGYTGVRAWERASGLTDELSAIEQELALVLVL